MIATVAVFRAAQESDAIANARMRMAIVEYVSDRVAVTAREVSAETAAFIAGGTEMTAPGFTAESSIYVTQYRYLTHAHGSATKNYVGLAGSCTCSDAGCDIRLSGVSLVKD